MTNAIPLGDWLHEQGDNVLSQFATSIQTP